MATIPRVRGVLFIALLAAGCGKHKATEAGAGSQTTAAAPAPTATVDAAPSVAPEGSAGSAGSAAAATTATGDVGAAITAVANRWNDALAARKADDLETVYASRVRLYGRKMTRNEVLKQKADALAKAPDYTQSLRNVTPDLRDSARPIVSFDKTWTSGGKKNSVMASLAFANEGGNWVVVEETDVQADFKLRQREAGNCEFAVMAAVQSAAEATKVGTKDSGMMIGSGPPDSPTYAVAVGDNNPEQFVTHGWFDVDPATGAVSQEDILTQDVKRVPVAPKLADAVKTACVKFVVH